MTRQWPIGPHHLYRLKFKHKTMCCPTHQFVYNACSLSSTPFIVSVYSHPQGGCGTAWSTRDLCPAAPPAKAKASDGKESDKECYEIDLDSLVDQATLCSPLFMICSEIYTFLIHFWLDWNPSPWDSVWIEVDQAAIEIQPWMDLKSNQNSRKMELKLNCLDTWQDYVIVMTFW